jgi:coenzyme F420-reducing hydrogenase beta subunit
MNSISEIRNCYGCGVCLAICPQKIIKLDFDENGFYQPQIFATDKCTDCGLCLQVCAFSHEDLFGEKTQKIDGYAAWSNDEQVRRKCSSGGVGFEVGKYLIENGYKAVGVRYNAETARAEHYIAETVEEFIPSIGSKYIQSYTVDAFSQFNRKEKYLVTGTPCQIDSLRRFFRLKKMEERVVFMDFFCHGVPSMLLWKKYLKRIEKITGKVTYASWRNKQTGWHDSWAMGFDGEMQGEAVNWHESYNMLIRERKTFVNSRRSGGDLFYKMFLNDSCLGKQCYTKCKYKALSSSADIRIGDLWGKTYRHDEKGVSGVLVFTQKGKGLIEALNNKITFIPCDTSIVTEGQMKVKPKKPYYYSIVNKLLLSNMPLEVIVKITTLFWFSRLGYISKRVIRKMSKTVLE